ncbi:PREDICTED: transmembrane and coiled-coil domain-containing protein 5B-like [Gavialis gangeticus]|uniref:transmembrane and coiled-coil domain-containing protein 5B-like n=1 Tax=Gavialis gangeticus TaxID=94835 RepID=UPI00092EB90B|nr:PREDICTED: transmembrane and coiled-coil domain-containing protein 5B-like [Gavialis gangeticus]
MSWSRSKRTQVLKYTRLCSLSLPYSHQDYQTEKMENTLIHNLSIANENLRNQIWNLRETAGELDAENQKLMKENQDIRDSNRRLQTNVDCFKTLVEDLQREVENAREMLEEKENQIKKLEFQINNWEKANEQLKTEIIELTCQVSAYQHDKKYQEKDMLGEQNIMYENEKYLKRLEDKLESEEQLYEQENLRACQLRDMLEEPDKIREVQRNDILQLKGQLEMSTQETALLRMVKEDRSQAVLLLEDTAEVKFPDNKLPWSKKHKFLTCTWNFSKLLLILVSCLGLSVALVFLYACCFNNDFIVDILPLLSSEHDLDLLIQILSPYLTWKNKGLLPF